MFTEINFKNKVIQDDTKEFFFDVSKITKEEFVANALEVLEPVKTYSTGYNNIKDIYSINKIEFHSTWWMGGLFEKSSNVFGIFLELSKEDCQKIIDVYGDVKTDKVSECYYSDNFFPEFEDVESETDRGFEAVLSFIYDYSKGDLKFELVEDNFKLIVKEELILIKTEDKSTITRRMKIKNYLKERE